MFSVKASSREVAELQARSDEQDNRIQQQDAIIGRLTQQLTAVTTEVAHNGFDIRNVFRLIWPASKAASQPKAEVCE